MPEPSEPSIDASTRYCAVLGHPVRHSASPAMQNAGIASLGLNWRYLAFDVHPDRLSAAIEGARRMHFIGLNLTVPHKLLAVGMLDSLSDSARIFGAVNTIRFEGRATDGLWHPLREFEWEPPHETRAHGFNTDADAIIRALREDLGIEPSGAKVLLLGAGGAGRTAALKLAAEGVKGLWIVNRTESKTLELLGEIKERYPRVTANPGYPDGAVDLMLNATSLGLHPADPLPCDRERIQPGCARAVYDMIYRPAETPLLKTARQAGCRAANGLGMLLFQGAAALELWSGQPAPVDIMRRALEKNVYG